MSNRLHLLKTFLMAIFVVGHCTFAQAQAFDWAKRMGGRNVDAGEAAATDKEGNVYVIGTFRDTADFEQGGAHRLISTPPFGSSKENIFIAKYNNRGNCLWAKAIITTASANHGYGIAVGSTGNIYITGAVMGTVDWGAGADTLIGDLGRLSLFIAKYDTDGNYLWAKAMTGNSSGISYAIALDWTDNIFITGYFTGLIDFDPGLLVANQAATGERDIFLAKYDSSGNYLWVKGLGGVARDEGYSVAVDTTGNVYVTGAFQSTVDFDPGTGVFLTSAGNFDVFLAKYDSSGNYLWAKRMGAPVVGDGGRSVTVSNTGNVYVAGSFINTADFNPGTGVDTLTTAGGNDIFLAKYDANGNYQWAKRMGSKNHNERGTGVAVDRAENIYLTGFFSDTADFDTGGPRLVSAGRYISILGFNIYTVTQDAFLAKYNTDGNCLWAKSIWGVGATDASHAVALDGEGNVYITGYFQDTANFNTEGSGTDTLVSAGNNDVFLVKFSCNDTSSSHLTVIECAETYTLNGEIYAASGTYIQKHPNTAGCDSILTLDLTFIRLEPVIAIDEFVLSVSGSYTSYQWIKNGVDIPGATEPTYTVTENADYQVRVTDENGCEATSATYVVTNVPSSIDHILSTQQINIYPNPAHDVIYIQSPVEINVTLYSIEGRIELQATYTKSIATGSLAEGLYLLHITDKEGRLIKVEKITLVKR